jgi:HEAT repeat protein
MLRLARFVATLTLAVGVLGSASLLAADKAALDAAFADLAKYDWGAKGDALSTIEAAVIASHGKADERKNLEKRLGAVLGGEAKQAAKQFACRQLSLMGTAESVPALAALLPDKDLSHMARYALERMPCPEAVAAMRGALAKAGGLQKVGIINSLGVRHDEPSVDAMIPLVKDSDAQVAAAAVAALGRIGSPKAAAPLAELRKAMPKGMEIAVMDASLDLAAALLKAGNKPEAEKIYTELNAETQPPAVRKAAFQGLVAVRPEQATPLLMQAISGKDEAMRGLALRLVRETPGEEATRTFAANLGKVPPAAQPMLIEALGARGDAAARAAIVEAAKSSDGAVKLAAIKALGMVGNASDVPALLVSLGAASKDESSAATASLTQLRGEGVNKAVAGALATSGPKGTLIAILSARAAKECAGDIAKFAADADAAVAAAAVDALGLLASAEQMPALIAAAKTAKTDEQCTAVQRSIVAVCGRDGAKCAPALSEALKDTKAPVRGLLLAGLARIGGPEALALVKADAKSADADTRDAGIRLLAEWSDATAAEELFAIASGAGDNVHKVLALRGYIRLARAAADAKKLEMVKKARPLAAQDNEKRLVLGVLGSCAGVEALQLVMPDLENAALVNEAAAAAVQIAGKLGKEHADVVRKAMATVLANVRDIRSASRKEAEKIIGKLGPGGPAGI